MRLLLIANPVKRRFGRLAYALSAAEALLAQPPNTVEIHLPDGRRRSGSGVVVSNARCYGGRYVITPQASLLSDRLELCLLRHGGRAAMLGYALRLGLHLPLRSPAVEYYSIDVVEISGAGVPVQVDGDPWGLLPVKVASVPNALSVVFPESFQGGEHG